MPNDPAVLFRDDDWLAVDKPSGLATTAPDASGVVSLASRVASRIAPGSQHAHPLSRLDVEVSGVVLFALSSRAVEAASRASASGHYQRVYESLVVGVTAAEGTWDAPIGAHPTRRLLRAVHPDGDPARTTFRRVGTTPAVSALRLTLQSGRTHQIRVHAAHAGHPILGDPAYGGPRIVDLEDGTTVHCARVMLHARAVRIPRRNAWVVAPWPSDLETCWRALGGGEVETPDLPARAQ